MFVQITVAIKSGESFTFDFVFSEVESRSELYEHAVINTTSKILKGYNATILAYGQTSSGKPIFLKFHENFTNCYFSSLTGKTYTMGTAAASSLVSKNDSGIIQKSVQELFFCMNKDVSVAFKTTVSFIEVCPYNYLTFKIAVQLLILMFFLCQVYMDNCYDLLSKNRSIKGFKIREDSSKNGLGIHIPGLSETEVTSCKETLNLLKQGSCNRHTGATAMNVVSSRSHAVFTLTIHQV